MSWSNSRPKSAAYGHAWVKTRRAWAARHDASDPCVRCGRALGPMGPWLHLDHDDHDRSIVRGFAHARCNVRAGAVKARALQARRTTSRDW